MENILFVMPSLGSGGAEKSLVNLLNLIDYEKYAVDLLLFKREGLFLSQIPRVYLRSQKCWDIRQKVPDARRISAALLGGMQANATQQMGLFGRI